MAKFVMNGIDELAAELKQLGQLNNGELVSDMLEAGAEVVADEWKKGIESTVKSKTEGGRGSGDLLKSVSVKKGITEEGTCYEKLIRPAGTDSKGVRNTEKAYILHYGKSGQPATRFVDAVEDAAEDKAIEVMEDVFNNYLEKEGF